MIPKILTIQVILLSVLIPFPAPAVESEWIIYENSTLLDNDYNDGDSFHVLAEGNKRRHYIFRLYFVDAPESDDRIPDRLQEQAAYWEITPAEVMALGREAAEFAEKLLDKTPFTVYTRKHDARGRSERTRYFAMIEIEGRFLSQILVEEGLARIYGQAVELPDGTREERHRSRLREAEKGAKKAGKGGWKKQGGAMDKPPVTRPQLAGQPLEPQELTLPRTILVYAMDPPHRAIGRLRSGHRVSVIKSFSATRAHIRFTLENGKTYEVLCNRADLGM